MTFDQILFQLGDAPVTWLRLGVAVFLLLGFAALAQVLFSYLSRRLLWPGSAGGNTVHLLLSVCRAEIILVGVLVAAATLGVPVLPVVWIFLAVGALSAVSGRTTFEQIWAGLFILWERPFALGERIVSGHYEGEVERVGLRTTTLRSEERMAVHVPNSYLTTHAIHNRSRTEGGFGLRIPVEVMVHCDSGEVIAALRRAAERNNRVRSSPSPKAFMTGFSPRGLQFELRAWVDAYTDATWAQNELCRAIQSEFQRAGIQLAASKTGSRPTAVEPLPRARPRPDADREPPRERGSDRGRDRDSKPERPRSDRSSRPERYTPSSETGTDARGRGRGRRTPESGSNARVEAAEEELPTSPHEESVEESAPVVMEESAPVMIESPMVYEAAPVEIAQEQSAATPFMEPEPASLPVEESSPENSSPTFGRSKRKVPRR